MTTPIRCGYVDTSWGQVHYRSAGNAGPWVGLFHESPLSSRVYEDVLVQLEPHCRAVAFDTPGYGSSALPPSATEEIPDYAEVLGQAAVAVGMKDAVFGGVHTGASIAIELAHSFAGGVAGVFLSGVPLFTDEERAQFLESWTPAMPIDGEGSQFDWVVDRYRRIWPGITPRMLHVAATEALRAGEHYDWAYNAAFRYQPSDALSRITAPVALIDAEFDMLADKDDVALALNPNARLTVLAGLQGQPHMRVPEDYACEILTFVTSIAAS